MKPLSSFACVMFFFVIWDESTLAIHSAWLLSSMCNMCIVEQSERLYCGHGHACRWLEVVDPSYSEPVCFTRLVLLIVLPAADTILLSTVLYTGLSLSAGVCVFERERRDRLCMFLIIITRHYVHDQVVQTFKTLVGPFCFCWILWVDCHNF